LKHVRPGREILDDAERAAEVHDRHQAIRAGVGLDEFFGRAARLNLIGRRHGGVVEKQDEIMRLGVRLRGGIGAGGEARDGLLFVVLEDLEIFLL
jgi:hypothetical protein